MTVGDNNNKTYIHNNNNNNNNGYRTTDKMMTTQLRPQKCSFSIVFAKKRKRERAWQHGLWNYDYTYIR